MKIINVYLVPIAYKNCVSPGEKQRLTQALSTAFLIDILL